MYKLRSHLTGIIASLSLVSGYTCFGQTLKNAADRTASTPISRPALALQVGHIGPVADVAFSPDGKTLASAGFDGTAKLWDIATGLVKATLYGHTQQLKGVIFSPNGTALATLSNDGTARLWDARTGTSLAVLKDAFNLAFSKNGDFLATSGAAGITLYSFPSVRVISKLPGVKNTVSSLATARPGRSACQMMDSSFVNPVTSLAISPNNHNLAAGHNDGTISIWDTRRRIVTRSLLGTQDFDPRNPAQTGLSGRELSEALGGALRAKSVFLFVDTCYSGGLNGRSEDLRFEVARSNVYFVASSGAKEYAYEGPTWKHGAFTLALLNSLNKKELAPDGVIRFNALTFGIPNEVATLMTAAGQNPSDQQPCIPAEGLNPREPLLSAAVR